MAIAPCAISSYLEVMEDIVEVVVLKVSNQYNQWKVLKGIERNTCGHRQNM